MQKHSRAVLKRRRWAAPCPSCRKVARERASSRDSQAARPKRPAFVPRAAPHPQKLLGDCPPDKAGGDPVPQEAGLRGPAVPEGSRDTPEPAQVIVRSEGLPGGRARCA